MGPCEIQLDLATVGQSLGSARAANRRPWRKWCVEK